jgi:glycosyltransferase involved in cell wall biosynthesis
LIFGLNATAFDERPSGARVRAVGITAALLRAGASVRVFVPIGTSMRADVRREFGGEPPEDRFEQIPSMLDPARPVRRFTASRGWFGRRISRDSDGFLTDYYPVIGKVPTFATVHDLRYFAARRFEPALRAAWFRAVYPGIARRAARIVVPTRAVAAEAERFLEVDAARIVVAPNGLSHAWRAAPPPAGIGRHLLMIGFDERRKDLATVLAALRRATSAPPLVLVGRGRLPFAARDLASAGRVRLADADGDDDVVALARDAAALVHPSRYEGFGLPVIEAMSVGVPVLAARSAAVEEVAGGHATLLPPGDADAWAAAISAIPPSPPAARDHAHSFTWDRAAAALIAAAGAVASGA